MVQLKSKLQLSRVTVLAFVATLLIIVSTGQDIGIQQSRFDEVVNLPEGLTDDVFISVDSLDNYVAAELREGESAQEFYFDDLMGLPAEEQEGGFQFSNEVFLISDTEEIQKLEDWATTKGARGYLVDAGNDAKMVFRNAFQSQMPSDPVIRSSAIQTNDDTNLCGYIAVTYVYNGLTGDTSFTPVEVILAQTTLPAGRGLTTFFPALPPLTLHLGGITARDLSRVADVVLEDTGFTSSLYRGLHSDSEIRNTIIGKLGQGLPVIAFVNIFYEGTSVGFRANANGVLQSDSNYGHFVVVTGIAEHDDSYVYRIKNPYDNRTEYYSEADFMSAIIKSEDTEFVGSLILFDRDQPEDVQ